MSPYPTKLERAGDDVLIIEWSDGQRRRYLMRELREACPCATCREKRREPPKPATLLPVLSIAETLPPRITSMKPVGNYAYGIEFNDGHNTGIFTFDFLRSLGEEF